MIRHWLPIAAMGMILPFATGCSSSADSPTPVAASRTSQDDQDAAVVVRRTNLKLEFTLDAATAGGSAIRLSPHPRLKFRPNRDLVDQIVRSGESIGTLEPVNGDGTAEDAKAGTGVTAIGSLAGSVEAPTRGRLVRADANFAIEAEGLDVRASLSPIQYLRYLSMPFRGTAHVESVLGPTSEACTAMWLELVDSPSNEAAAVLTCRLPSHVQSAPGLRATLTITSDEVRDVLVAPNRSIGYDETTNSYYVVLTRGDGLARAPVAVGATDGVVRVIEGDVSDGATLGDPADSRAR